MILLEWQKILQAQNDKLIPANAYWGIDICSCDCIKLRVHLNPLWHATIRSASFGNFSPTFDRNCLVEEETDDYGTDVLSRWKGKKQVLWGTKWQYSTHTYHKTMKAYHSTNLLQKHKTLKMILLCSSNIITTTTTLLSVIPSNNHII